MKELNVEEFISGTNYNPNDLGIRSMDSIDRSVMSDISHVISNHVAVIDCDECLFNIADKWVMNFINNVVKKNRDTYSFLDDKLLDNLLHMSQSGVINLRDSYNLEDLFRVEDPDNKKRLYKDLMETFFKDGTFYQDLPDTPLANTIKQLVENTNYLNEIHVVSKVGLYADSPVNESKKKRLDELFSGLRNKARIHYHFLLAHEKKSDLINKELPIVNLFIDDHYENIKDVVMNTNLTTYEIYMPAYGYNYKAVTRQEKDYADALHDNAVVLKAFHNFHDGSIDKEDFAAYMHTLLSEKDPAFINNAIEQKAKHNVV